MKKLITILTIFALTSCANWASQERKKSGQNAAASDRINQSDENSKSVFKELDE